MQSTIKEYFEFIAKNWTIEMYKEEKDRYKKICSRILLNETESSRTCYRCKTIWNNTNMVSDWSGCCQGDQNNQPCLSNSINKESVLKDGGQSGTASTVVGATKEDLEALGVSTKDNSQDTIDLNEAVAEKGGSMSMDDIIKLHGA